MKKSIVFPFLGVLVLSLLVFFGSAIFQPSGSNNFSFASIEKRVASFSPNGIAGGISIPASCESGYEHTPGECTPCSDPTAYNYGEAGACVYLPTPTLYFNPSSVPYGAGAAIVWSWPEPGGTRYCNINTYGSEWNGYAYGQDISGSYNYGGMNAFGSATATCYKYNTGRAVWVASSQANATLIVTSPPPGDFSLNPPSAACNSVSLSWTASTGANAYRILKGTPRVDISPYQPYTALNFVDYSVSQNTDYLYQIEAYNGAGTNRSNARNVTTPYCPPSLNFSSNPTSIFEGQSSTLTWSSANATSCNASGAWSGNKLVNGSEVVIPSPPPSATYTLTCTGPGGSAAPQSVTINITPLALPDWREIIPR